MGRINVKQFKNEPLETLETETGTNWYVYRPTEETRHKVQGVLEDHEARVEAYQKDLLARMEAAREAATEAEEDNPDAAARKLAENDIVPVNVTPRYRAAAIVAAHMKPAGLDAGEVLEELGESLVNYLFERVTQETTGEAAKKLLAGPGSLRGL